MTSERTNPNDWTIVIACGQSFLGKLVENRLTDAFTLSAQAMQVGPQQVEIVHGCMPVLFMNSFDSFEVPVGAIVKPCSELSESDRRYIFNAVNVGVRAAEELRMKQSGIQVVRPNMHAPTVKIQ